MPVRVASLCTQQWEFLEAYRFWGQIFLSQTMSSVPLQVCAAIVIHDGRLLLATRRPGSHCAGQWEFPGGKCQAGETMATCIARELQEELSLSVTVSGEYCSLRHDYPEKSILLHFMLCQIASGASPDAVPLEGQQWGWFSPNQWSALEFTPADHEFMVANRTQLVKLCEHCA